MPIIFVSLIGCTKYEYNVIENNNYSIEIEKINLNKEYVISSINDEIRHITMFSEYGRPDLEGSNTIIGAHSGIGIYAHFNDLNILEVDDKIKVNYNNRLFEYKVKEVKEVSDTQVDILKSKDISMVTLLTCKVGDSSKRIIVIGELID